MDFQEIVKKLQQIEEQAQLTLEEYPTLTKERQRMIIALCRFVATELAINAGPQAVELSNEDELRTGLEMRRA